MLTVDFDRLAIGAGTKVMKLDAVRGRHSFEAYRRGRERHRFGPRTRDINDVDERYEAMKEQGEVCPGRRGPGGSKGDALDCPSTRGFRVCHRIGDPRTVPEDDRAIASWYRVVETRGGWRSRSPLACPDGSVLAHTTSNHATTGGPLRIGYLSGETRFRDKVLGHVTAVTHRHHAHALHRRFLWLKCDVGTIEVEHSASPPLTKLGWGHDERPCHRTPQSLAAETTDRQERSPCIQEGWRCRSRSMRPAVRGF